VSAHHHAAADAGAEDHAEHAVGTRSGTVGRFRQREAVGVVGDSYCPVQRTLEVFLQRLAVEAGRVAVLHAPAGRRNRAGCADADAAAFPQFVFDLVDQCGHRGHGCKVIVLRGRHAAAQDFAAPAIERDEFDLGAAEVDAETERRGRNARIAHYFCVGIDMAGHSKWANIQHRKGRQDAKRGKIFTKLIKEITVAAKMGGGDPAMNPRLRLAIEKGKAESLPKDNIENAIKRGTGQLEGVNYEEVRYEGYGIGGVAVMVDCLTDNNTRTVADVRHAFTKHGGNMGTDGCVAFQFKHCGQIILEPGASEEAVMEAALDAGADDIIPNEDGSIEVLTSPDPKAFEAVKDALEKAGFKPAVAEITMRPEAETELAGDDAVKMQKILDALESLDDVQEVYTNAVLPE